jgi:NAD(P)H-flavin reductase
MVVLVEFNILGQVRVHAIRVVYCRNGSWWFWNYSDAASCYAHSTKPSRYNIILFIILLDTTKVELVFANVTEEDIICRKEIDALKAEHPDRINVHYVLDKPSKGWTGLKGHVNKDLLEKVLPPPSDPKAKVLVCGPPGMMNAISGDKAKDKSQGEVSGMWTEMANFEIGILKSLGYSKEQVFKY